MKDKDNISLEQLRKIVSSQLGRAGVQQGVSKPGDGRYSALLSKNASTSR